MMREERLMSGSGSMYGDGFGEDPSFHNGTPTDIYDDNESKKSQPVSASLQKSNSNISKPFTLQKQGVNMPSHESKSKPLRFFVNNYDHLPTKGPIFIIKKTSKVDSANEAGFAKPSKVNGSAPGLPSSNTDGEPAQKKAFKITKKSVKKESSSSKQPVTAKQGKKEAKEGKKKLNADLVPSPNTSPTDSSPVAQKISLKKVEEDKKSRESQRASKVKKKVAPAEPAKKIAEDDFNTFLFNGSASKRRTRGPKKVKRNIREPGLKASERV
jgi:hypothetical protein